MNNKIRKKKEGSQLILINEAQMTSVKNADKKRQIYTCDAEVGHKKKGVREVREGKERR